MTAITAKPDDPATDPDAPAEFRVRVVLEYRERPIGTAWTALDITDAEFSNADMTSPSLSDDAAFRLAGHLAEQMAVGLELEGGMRCTVCRELPGYRLHGSPAALGFHSYTVEPAHR